MEELNQELSQPELAQLHQQLANIKFHRQKGNYNAFLNRYDSNQSSQSDQQFNHNQKRDLLKQNKKLQLRVNELEIENKVLSCGGSKKVVGKLFHRNEELCKQNQELKQENIYYRKQLQRVSQGITKTDSSSSDEQKEERSQLTQDYYHQQNVINTGFQSKQNKILNKTAGKTQMIFKLYQKLQTSKSNVKEELVYTKKQLNLYKEKLSNLEEVKKQIKQYKGGQKYMVIFENFNL